VGPLHRRRRRDPAHASWYVKPNAGSECFSSVTLSMLN
jgi:hypothetical protein